MSETSPILRSGQSLSQVLMLAEASDEALAVLKPGRGARAFFELLVRRNLFEDAVLLLAHVLPPREAVWWAWSCARDVAGAEPPARVAASLEATKLWILEPTDENRRAAFAAAEGVDFDGPAGIVGLGVFLCGDNVAPLEAPVTPSEPHVAAKALAGGICMAAATKEEGVKERFRAFIARGLERADKGNVWEPDPASTARS